MSITVLGLEPLKKQIAKLDAMTNAIQGYHGYVGSRQPYAWGEETGSHRVSGKLARAMGGTFYLERAMTDMLAMAEADIAQGMELAGGPGPWVIKRLGLWTRRLARTYAPEGPTNDGEPAGRLRRSIKFETGRG